MKKLLTTTFAAILGLVALPTFAEELQMPDKPQSQPTSMPKRGMNKQQVEAKFGSPQSKHGPTGTPPIYFWEYPSYTVYFESDIVLHTVSKYR